MQSTYEQSVAQLLTLADFERRARANESPDFHIRRTELLLELLGNPHRSVPAIHVAGSKGKSSTAAMITAGLTANGLCTALFVSPHLHRMTERFTVDARPISPERFVSLFERVWPAAESVRERGDTGMVTVFEFQTAMAFMHFADISADAMVIEVGLGGRLDSTNVLTPVVSVITPVGLDHVAVLGDTLAKIAAEKAGIIKPGVPVVSARQASESADVISNTARRLGASLTHSSSVRVVSAEPNGAGPQLLRLQSPIAAYNIRLPLLGEHQIDNVVTAIAALETFGARTRPLDSRGVEHGISGVNWPGRVQLLESGPPLLIADGAHSHDSAIALKAAIIRHFGPQSAPVLVLGATGGHDPLAVVRAFSDLSPRVIVTRSRHPKAVDPDDFASALQQVNISAVAVTRTTREALVQARQIAGENGAIIATGSLFIAAEVIETVSGIQPEMYSDIRGSADPVRLTLLHPREVT
jgi:dihydrofolate synthase/folylpolyglutamate synthase